MNKPITVVGFVLREDYADLLAVSVDVPIPHPPFEVWVKRQQDGMNSLRAQGVEPVQVNVKPLEMAAWCKANGKIVDSVGRAAYAAYVFTRFNK